jgi:hypothetical protein
MFPLSKRLDDHIFSDLGIEKIMISSRKYDRIPGGFSCSQDKPRR